MRSDLDKYFGLDATVEKRLKKCLVLIRTNNSRLETSGGTPDQVWEAGGISVQNKPFSTFVAMLRHYHQTSIFLDETGFDGNVDIAIDATMTDIEALRNSLRDYGLDIIKADRKVKMLILKD